MRQKRLIEYLLIFDNSSTRKNIIQFLGYIIVFTILIAFSELLLVYKDNNLAAFKYSTYDYKIQGLTKQQVEELSSLPFVDSILPYSLLNGRISTKKSDKEASVTLMRLDSFQKLEESFFVPHNLVAQNKKIMSNPDLNPIILSYSLAKYINTSVGNKVIIPIGESEEEIEFTVGAIYLSVCVNGIFDAAILWQDPQKSLIKEEEECHWTTAFVKSNNMDKMRNYLENDFFPLMIFETDMKMGNYKSEDDLWEYYESSNYNTEGFYISRQTELKKVEDSLKYTPKVIVITTILGFVIFGILLYRDENKKINELMYTITILFSLGLKKRRIQFIYIIKMLIFSIPSSIIAILLNKFFVYRFLTENLYVTWDISIKFGAVILILVLFSVIITSGILMHKINVKKIAYYLHGEG